MGLALGRISSGCMNRGPVLASGSGANLLPFCWGWFASLAGSRRSVWVPFSENVRGVVVVSVYSRTTGVPQSCVGQLETGGTYDVPTRYDVVTGAAQGSHTGTETVVTGR